MRNHSQQPSSPKLFYQARGPGTANQQRLVHWSFQKLLLQPTISVFFLSLEKSDSLSWSPSASQKRPVNSETTSRMVCRSWAKTRTSRFVPTGAGDKPSSFKTTTVVVSLRHCGYWKVGTKAILLSNGSSKEVSIQTVIAAWTKMATVIVFLMRKIYIYHISIFGLILIILSFFW